MRLDDSGPLLEPYDRTVRIYVLGRPADVPENNPLLRGFQTLCCERVSHGRFCWNHECGNSKFYYRFPGETLERKARACRLEPVEGMQIIRLSPELQYVLAPFLSKTPVIEGSSASAPSQGEGVPPEVEDDPFPEIRFKNER